MLPLLLVLAGGAQDAAFPPDRYGAYAGTLADLRGATDALALEGGGWLVVERDRDRLTRVAPDGARARFGPDDLDAPEDVAALPGGGYAVADAGNRRVVLLDAAGAATGRLEGFRAPSGVAADAEHLFVADPPSGRVARFRLGAGSAPEPAGALAGLVAPVAVEPGPDGRVFVVDAGAHAVVVFDAQGARVRAWGDFGPHAGFLGHPRDLAVAGGRVHVADADNHRVQVFDLEGRYVYEWGKHALRPREGEGSLHYPSGIALADGPGGPVALVCEAFQDRAQLFARTEEDPARFVTDPGILPWSVSPHYGPDLAVEGDLLAIVEPETQTVLVFDLELDEPVEVVRFGGYGDAPGRSREIADLAIERDPWRVLVADRLLGTVSVWDLDHEPDAPLKMDPRMASFARSFRPLPDEDGRPARLGAIARAWDGALALVDESDGSVWLVPPDGEPRALARLDRPVDLAFDGELLFVADRGARRVVALDRDGATRRSIEGPRRPRGVAVGPDGTVYATDEVGHRVLAAGGGGERWIGAEGLGPGELYRPAGIALDDRGRLIVLDHGNHRGMVFDPEAGFLLAFGPRGYVKPTRGAAPGGGR